MVTGWFGPVLCEFSQEVCDVCLGQRSSVFTSCWDLSDCLILQILPSDLVIIVDVTGSSFGTTAGRRPSDVSGRRASSSSQRHQREADCCGSGRFQTSRPHMVFLRRCPLHTDVQSSVDTKHDTTQYVCLLHTVL